MIFNKISKKVKESAESMKSGIQSVLMASAMFVPNVLLSVRGDGIDLCQLSLDIMDFIRKAGFYGAILGVAFFGLSKIIDVFFPEIAGQTRDYIRKLAMGVIILGAGTSLVGYMFSVVGLDFAGECAL